MRRNDVVWYRMYEIAKNYYNKYGNLNIVQSFKTNDGIMYDDNGIYLGMWIHNQRNTCNPESERGRLLLKIGMNFENKNLNWKEMYLRAKLYFIEHGNLLIPIKFKTEDGYNLGRWISTQRMSYKNDTLSYERIYLLNLIGMIWDISKNKYDIIFLCDKNKIDVVKNKVILNHMSFLEFKVKFDFINGLKDDGYNIDFIDEKGMLHEIFSMSSMNMKLKYGVSLEDLVNIYNKGMNK